MHNSTYLMLIRPFSPHKQTRESHRRKSMNKITNLRNKIHLRIRTILNFELIYSIDFVLREGTGKKMSDRYGSSLPDFSLSEIKQKTDFKKQSDFMHDGQEVLYNNRRCFRKYLYQDWPITYTAYKSKRGCLLKLTY